MSAGIRRTIAAFVTLVVIMSIASPAMAQTRARSQQEAANAPVVFDVLVMRPVGFVSLLIGTGLFVASTPLVLVTRPHQVDVPFEKLVVKPAKFLWSDSLGGH